MVKVFLRRGTESDIRVDASQLGADGNPGVRWDIFMKGAGQVQPDKAIKREFATR